MRRAMATPPGPFSMQDLVAAVAKVYLDRLNLLFRLGKPRRTKHCSKGGVKTMFKNFVATFV